MVTCTRDHCCRLSNGFMEHDKTNVAVAVKLTEIIYMTKYLPAGLVPMVCITTEQATCG